MGGYSALKIGLRRNIFKGIGSFSGLTDAFVTKENFDPEFPRMYANNLVVEEDDLFYLANSLQTKLPSVYLYCGTSDSLYRMNVEYAKIISKKTKKFKFDTDERGHVWPAWRDALVAFINFID